MKKTKKAFQEHLNQEDLKRRSVIGPDVNPLWKGSGTRGQRVRLYGDYLRQADPEMFEVEYKEWLKAAV